MKLLFAVACLGSIVACAGTDEGGTSALGPTGSARAFQSADALPTYLYEMRGTVIDPRLGTAPVVDPNRRRTSLFGGWSGGSVRSDTIEWDGLGWQRRASDGQPGARFAASSLYDTRLRRTLLFGGFGVTSPNLALTDNLLWEWSGANWSIVPTENPPPAHGAASFVQNPITGEIWLFGGSAAGSGAELAATDDLYKFDGLRWTKIERTADKPWPLPRGLAAMTFDPASGKIMLFGGFGIFDTNVTGYPSIGEPREDTWSWDGTTWTEHVTAEAPKGEVISLDNGAPIPLAGRQTMLHSERLGGLLLVHEALDGVQIWRYDPATPTWTLIAKPVANGTGPNFRLLSGAFLDPISGDVVVIGGLATGVPLGLSVAELAIKYSQGDIDTDTYFQGAMSNEQWSFDGSTWRARTTPGDPGPRVETSAAYDESRELAVMYGGRFGSSATPITLDDTWIWNGGHWTEAAGQRPPARRQHALAYDPVRKAIVLFGGADENDQALDDTWLWNGAWSKLEVTAAPTPRRAHTLVRSDAGIVLFGGLLADGTHGQDTWLLRSNASEWIRIAYPVSSISYDSCYASGPGIGPFMFGGIRVGDNGTTDDFFQFDQPSQIWLPVAVDDSVSVNLGPRSQCMLFADPTRGRVLIGGGLGGGVDENWNYFDLASRTWFSMVPEPYDRLQDPPRRVAAAAYFFDPKLGGPTYYGGRAAGVDTTISETWRIREVGSACRADGTCANGNSCVEGVCCESAACGPCESCAVAGSRGVCTPLGTITSTPGCAAEQGLACNPAGRCRGGDGAVCSTDPQCASGTCIAGICCSAAGCAQRCVDDDTQRNPDGTQTECGAYACRGSACRVTCSALDDCAPGNVCTSTGQCVAVGNGQGQEPGGCNVGVGPAAGSWLFGLASLLLLRRRRVP